VYVCAHACVCVCVCVCVTIRGREGLRRLNPSLIHKMQFDMDLRLLQVPVIHQTRVNDGPDTSTNMYVTLTYMGMAKNTHCMYQAANGPNVKVVLTQYLAPAQCSVVRIRSVVSWQTMLRRSSFPSLAAVPSGGLLGEACLDGASKGMHNP
jgi:hypothetical protein